MGALSTGCGAIDASACFVVVEDGIGAATPCAILIGC